MKGLEIDVFAKINIGLEVFARRSTGYHDIESIFQSVSLSDALRLCASGSGSIVVEGEMGCPPTKSTIYQAAEVFDDACGGLVHKKGVSIRVEKGIPSGAGLGGAGADAAAVLWGLNELFETRLTGEELAHLGERVASDVPFFLFGGAAIVRGRGERITPILPRDDFGLLLLQPSWTSLTSEAYEDLDLRREKRYGIDSHMADMQAASYASHLSDKELEICYRSPIAQWRFGNDFQPVLVEKHPEYQELLLLLEELGAEYASLTGSGSCVFGVFNSAGRAQKARAKYKNLAERKTSNAFSSIVNIFAIQPLARSMNVSYIQDCNEDTRSDKERPCYGSD